MVSVIPFFRDISTFVMYCVYIDSKSSLAGPSLLGNASLWRKVKLCLLRKYRLNVMV